MSSLTSQVAAAATSHDDVHVLHARQLRPGVTLAGTSRFSEDIWHLEAAQLQNQQTALSLNFTGLNGWHRELLKTICYTMLSGPLPLEEDRPALNTIRHRLSRLRPFLAWLPAELTGLHQVTSEHLQAYQLHLLHTTPALVQRQSSRAAIRLLWRYRSITGFPLDPNRLRAWGAHKRPAENATDRIPEEVLQPLLRWAVRFVDEFAPDILSADRHRLAAHSAPQPHLPWSDLEPRLRTLLDSYRHRRRCLPSFRGKPNLNALASEIGCARHSLLNLQATGLITTAATELGLDGGTAFPIDITATTNNAPWAPALFAKHSSPFALSRMMRHLQVSCFILIAYFSGMRHSEIKHLRRGCLRSHLDTGGRPYRHTVTSRAFKGESSPEGVEATWVVGEPAARAIRVLEKLQPAHDDWLFSILAYGPGNGPRSRTSIETLGGTATINQLNAFAAWIGEYCAAHGHTDTIPAVNGRRWWLTSTQFRRTLAWFIARQPGGAIAGAIQYRHQAIQMFEGYAGTSDSGFRAEVEAEQALTRGETLLAMIDRHEHNHLTGPAATTAQNRLKTFGERAAAPSVVADPRQLRRLLARADPAIYPGKFVTCVFDPAKAACLARHKNTPTGPALGDCQPLECPNVALTGPNRDTWADEISELVTTLEQHDLPPLLAQRLRQRHDAMQRFTERHRTEELNDTQG